MRSWRLKSWPPADTSRGTPVVVAGEKLPPHVGATLSGPMRVLCIGPREWLIVSHEHEASYLRERIAPDLPNHGLVLVDLSDGLVVLEAKGSSAREILSKGCGLDLHPRTFPSGQCARTRLAQIPVVVDCLDDRFELYAGRSYARYLQSWLTDASS